MIRLKTLVVVGCGDIGLRIVRRLDEVNVSISAWVRRRESVESCNEIGVDVMQVDLDGELPLPPLPEHCSVIYLVPPPANGHRDPRIRRFLASLRYPLQRMILISTTGVYGNSHGDWIDESFPCQPSTDRGRRRLDAEQSLTEWCGRHNTEYLILRVPGIYAQDRLPLARLKRGDPVLRRDQAPFTNRIHAEDLARVCRAAVASRQKNLVVNVTDGSPCSMTDYFFKVADACGIPRPPEISMEEAQRVMSPGMLSYQQESRRIHNRRLVELFGFEFEYPNLDATLTQVPRS